MPLSLRGGPFGGTELLQEGHSVTLGPKGGSFSDTGSQGRVSPCQAPLSSSQPLPHPLSPALAEPRLRAARDLSRNIPRLLKG